jgi:hypothetical protein
MRREQTLEVGQRQTRHLLTISDRLAVMLIDDDPLEETPCVGPAADVVVGAVDGETLGRDQVRVCVAGVQVIQHQRAARRQRGDHVGDDSALFGLGVEVAEAGEEAKDVVIRATPEGLTHVVSAEAQRRTGVRAGLGDRTRREVQAGDVEPHAGEVPGVAARAAPEIEHGGARGRTEPGNQAVDEPGRLAVVAMPVEPLVMDGIEPGGKPR